MSSDADGSHSSHDLQKDTNTADSKHRPKNHLTIQ